MLHKTANLIFALGILLTFALACNFKFGETSDSSNKEVSRKKSAESDNKSKKKSEKKDKENTSGEKETSSESETDSPQKLGGYRYQRFDYSMYLIPKNLSKDELTEIARDLHEQEPKTILLLVDDDEQAEQFINYHEQLEDFHEQTDADKPKAEYPHDWANKHIVGAVNLFLEGGERSWYLVEGSYLSDKKISKLE